MTSLWHSIRHSVLQTLGMIQLKSQREIGLLRECAGLVSRTLAEVGKNVRPGATPLELDALAETFIRDHGAEPAFLGHEANSGTDPFPATLCTSVNDAVVHGIPTDTPLEEGDVLSVDCGVFLNKYVGDSAYTFAVGDLSEADRELCRVTYEALGAGIEAATGEHHTGDIGAAVEAHCAGYGIVEALCGHGVGRSMWEEPQVPNYGTPGEGAPLRDGLVFCVEPMINHGTADVETDADGWTVRTADGRTSAHYEYMVAMVDGHAEVLSSFDPIERAIGDAPPYRHAADSVAA